MVCLCLKWTLLAGQLKLYFSSSVNRHGSKTAPPKSLRIQVDRENYNVAAIAVGPTSMVVEKPAGCLYCVKDLKDLSYFTVPVVH